MIISKIISMVLGKTTVISLFKNTSWLLAEKLIRMLFGVIVGAAVARHLGPSIFGELAYAISLCAFLQVLITLGLDNIVVRDISNSRDLSGNIIGTVLRLRFLVAVIGWFLVCAIFYFIRPEDYHGLTIVVLVAASMLFQPADVIDLWFQSQTQSKKTAIAKSSAFLLATSAKIVLIAIGADVVFFAAVQIVETGFSALFMYLSYRKYPCESRLGWDMATAIRLLKQGWPFLLSGMSIIIYMRIDQIMLREMVGEAELGIYSAALPFSQAWNIFPVIIGVSLLPYMSRLYKKNETEFFRYLQLLFGAYFWLSLIVVVFTYAISDHLVNILLGEQFITAVDVLRVHVVTNVFIYYGVAQIQWIVNCGKGSVAMTKTLMGALVNIVGNYILIPKFGAVGAAYSAVLAQAVSAVLSNILIAKKIFIMQIVSPFVLPRLIRETMHK